VNLADAIQKAHVENERAMAAQLPRYVADDDAKRGVAPFVRFCGERGVRALPAAPASIAAFVRFVGKDQEALAEALAGVAAMHDQHQLPSPTATACVRAALAETLELKPPRWWTEAEKLLFSDLPAEVRTIVSRRDHQRETDMRRLQNELADLKKRQGAADERTVIAKDTNDEHSQAK
jgi:hypothetical protein